MQQMPRIQWLEENLPPSKETKSKSTIEAAEALMAMKQTSNSQDSNQHSSESVRSPLADKIQILENIKLI